MVIVGRWKQILHCDGVGDVLGALVENDGFTFGSGV